MTMNTDKSSAAIYRNSIKRFLFIFFLSGSLISGLLTLFYQKETLNYVESIKSQEKYAVDLQQQQIELTFNNIFNDLFLLRNQNELQRFLKTGDSHHLTMMAKENILLSQHSRQYDQIRYLDLSGREMVRVNYNNGSPGQVPQAQLQVKADRYYFKECLQQLQDAVYISPFDLNIEHGEIERPFKPVIRICTPVYDETEKKRGVVLLNYLGTHLLNTIRAAEQISPGRTMLVNREGYWLLHPQPEMEWGFMFEEGKESRAGILYPELWREIQTLQRGRVETAGGLFTFAQIFPLSYALQRSGYATGAGQADPDAVGISGPGRDSYSWYLISEVPQSAVDSHTRVLRMKLFLFGAGIFFLAGIGSWILAYSVSKRKILQNQLKVMAYFDPLTDLPNRTHFFDRLEEAASYSSRYQGKLALLYIDLDGFKFVNDSFGHDTGDRVLEHVAGCLRKICRKSDTLARLGGDEFAVLLPGCKGKEDVSTVAAKIIAVLSQPFSVSGHEVSIGASIGIAFFPQDGESREALVTMADSAMYYAKAKGKNQFLSYSDTLPEE